jgi:deazaflavin-dependent oxidoreductase (nitroreductase family)
MAPIEGTYVPSPSHRAREQVAEYEASDGERGGTLLGLPVVILTTRGARSGDVRKTPLMRVEHDGAYLAVGSLGGAAHDPDWCHNVRAHPQVGLQDRAERLDLVARELTGPERAVWWARAVEVFPQYERYQARTDRLIPVFLLEHPTEHDPAEHG